MGAAPELNVLRLRLDARELESSEFATDAAERLLSATDEPELESILDELVDEPKFLELVGRYSSPGLRGDRAALMAQASDYMDSSTLGHFVRAMVMARNAREAGKIRRQLERWEPPTSDPYERMPSFSELAQQGQSTDVLSAYLTLLRGVVAGWAVGYMVENSVCPPAAAALCHLWGSGAAAVIAMHGMALSYSRGPEIAAEYVMGLGSRPIDGQLSDRIAKTSRTLWSQMAHAASDSDDGVFHPLTPVEFQD